MTSLFGKNSFVTFLNKFSLIIENAIKITKIPLGVTLF